MLTSTFPAAALALVRFCSTLALLSCGPTTLQVPLGHAANPNTATPLADLSAARLDRTPALDETELTFAAAGPDLHHHDQRASATPQGTEAEHAAASRWTCPMHPEVLRDAPGNCPLCGMHLVEKKSPPPGGQP